jgi:hypothetical protein
MGRREKLYESIVDDIRKKYDGKLSEAETHEAARNLIAFVKIMLEVHAKSD